MKGGTKVRWNRALVVARAAELADREGLVALTLTRLAADLGIRPPSLFNHVESLDALVRDLGLGALTSLGQALEQAASGSGSPEEVLAQTMGAYRAFVRSHPGQYAATLAFPASVVGLSEPWAEADRRIVDVGLALASRFGLQGAEALHTLRAWRALAHGFSDLERLGGFAIPMDQDESFLRAVTALTPIRR